MQVLPSGTQDVQNPRGKLSGSRTNGVHRTYCAVPSLASARTIGTVGISSAPTRRPGLGPVASHRPDRVALQSLPGILPDTVDDLLYIEKARS